MSAEKRDKNSSALLCAPVNMTQARVNPSGGSKTQKRPQNASSKMLRTPPHVSLPALSLSELPFGQLPILSVDGDVFPQSAAILRYAGKLGGL